MGWMTNQPDTVIGQIVGWVGLAAYFSIGLMWQMRYFLLFIFIVAGIARLFYSFGVLGG